MRGVKPGLRYRILWLSSPEANRLILLAAAAVLMAMSLVFTMSRSGISALAVSLVLTGWLVVAGIRQDDRGARRSSCISSSCLRPPSRGSASTRSFSAFRQTNWSEFNNRRGAWLDAAGVVVGVSA